MAVRRRDSNRSGGRPATVEELLAWSRWEDVPEEFLEHRDPELRALAAQTQETVVAFLTSIWKSVAAGGQSADDEAELWEAMNQRYAALASTRRAFGERRGLRWRHPYPSAGFVDPRS